MEYKRVIEAGIPPYEVRIITPAFQLGMLSDSVKMALKKINTGKPLIERDTRVLEYAENLFPQIYRAAEVLFSRNMKGFNFSDAICYDMVLEATGYKPRGSEEEKIQNQRDFLRYIKQIESNFKSRTNLEGLLGFFDTLFHQARRDSSGEIEAVNLTGLSAVAA